MLTLAEIKSSWIKTASNDLDTQINGWIAIANRKIKSICRQPILQESIDYTFVGNDRQVRLAHVTTVLGAITLVQYRGNPFNSYQTQTSIDVSSFNIEGVYYFYREGYFTSDLIWKLTMLTGFPINDIPKDIKAVHGEMVYQLFKESPFATDVRVLGVSSIQKSQGGPSGTVINTTFENMVPRWQHMLEPYTIYTA
jgi:hypothetical protein